MRAQLKRQTVQVRMEDGFFAACRVIERMGFNHDVGARVARVEFAGKEFMVVAWAGKWRKWASKDRVQI